MNTGLVKKLDNSLFSPELFGHYARVSDMLSKSSIVPACFKGKPGDIFIALEMGYQLGLPVIQSVQDISVINGKPCIYGDGLMALVLVHPDCEDIHESPIFDEKGDIKAYSCTVKRRGHDAYTKEFTVDMAKHAKLWGKPGPWTSYPARMLQMRARSWALRDKFADALRGVKTVEEVEDYEIVEINPKAKITSKDKLKSTLGVKDDNNSAHVDSRAYAGSGPDYDVSDEYADLLNQERTKVTEVLLQELHQVINQLLLEKSFNNGRLKGMLAHYKVESIEQLDHAQSLDCLEKLRRIPC